VQEKFSLGKDISYLIPTTFIKHLNIKMKNLDFLNQVHYFYNMSFQQLDLFGNPIPMPQAKKKPELVVPKQVDPIVETAVETEQIIVIPPAIVAQPVVEILPQIITEETPKIKSNRGRKPKPKPELGVQIVKAKRGRKSYTEAYDNVDLVDIPSDEKLKEKLYYSISEVAGWFNVTTSQLRFWENEFTILKPRKNRKGDRLFRPEDIQNLKIIHYLLRHRKFSIEGAKDYFKTNKHKTEIAVQLQESLTNIKSFLLELKANL
jgi:DNA-binding transcriptional MerR regulator